MFSSFACLVVSFNLFYDELRVIVYPKVAYAKLPGNLESCKEGLIFVFVVCRIEAEPEVVPELLDVRVGEHHACP